MKRAVVMLLLLATAGVAQAQTVTLHSDRRDIHAGLPFVLSIAAEGFDETPEPKPADLAIAGAQVTALGMTPNVSSMVSIVNGRRSETRSVTFVYRFRVVVPAAGNYNIPSVAVVQGNKRASSDPVSFKATAVEATRDMQLRVETPERPLWVGETVDVTIEWYLRRDVSDRSLVVPLLDAQEWFDVEPPPGDAADKLAFSAGAKEIELPYTRDTATLDGTDYTRFRFRARATALKPGVVELPPARVIAALAIGEGRDAFGFRVPRSQLYQAEDRARRVEIKPLPVAGKPASFANAVGSGFALDVAADRTVARAGDPIELSITVRGQGRLKGLILPDLSADGGLSPRLFTLPDQPPAGEIIEDGKAKRFRLAVRLESTDATEIPPLAFSYFDPETATYRTVRSRPIALQVAGSTKVGAGDVVRATPTTGGAPSSSKPGGAPTSLVGADLSLSRPDRTLSRPMSIADLGAPLALLYGAPLLILGVQLVRRRTSRRREEQGVARQGLRAVDEALAAAAKRPARDAAPQVAAALRQLMRTLALPASAAGDLLERLEVEAFRPEAQDGPLARALLDEAGKRARGWLRERPPGGAGAALLLALAVAIPASARAGGDAPAEARLASAREAYMQALGEKDRDRRTGAFARAEAQLGALVAELADRPELLCDWGNAALGAQDVGRATLAFRRALRLAPDLARARRNLDWVRKQAPEWLPRPERVGAIESLFFWHQSLSVPRRHLIAASCFALAILLLTPIAADPRRRRRLRRAAAVPIVVLAAMAVSLAVERDARADAVVTGDSVVVRAADSAGAPAVLPRPLPAGAEVTIDEAREGWARIRLGDGTAGWVQRAAIERVVGPPQG